MKGAALKRPAPDADAAEWFAYVYLRENPKGPHREYWRHSGGCRRWLIVTRDTATHEVHAVSDAGAEP